MQNEKQIKTILKTIEVMSNSAIAQVGIDDERAHEVWTQFIYLESSIEDDCATIEDAFSYLQEASYFFSQS